MIDRQSDGYIVQVSVEPRRDPGEQALQRLIGDTISQDEVAPLIEAVLASRKAIEGIGSLQRNGAQAIIDIFDKVPCYLSIFESLVDFDNPHPR